MVSFLSRVEYERDWKAIHDSIFSGREHAHGAFVHNDWRAIVIVGELPEQDLVAANALINIATAAGGRTLVGINREQLNACKFAAFSTPLSADSLFEICMNLDNPTDGHIFSESPHWGLIYNPADSLYVFSASIEVFDEFVKVAGEQRLRDEFERFANAFGAAEHTVRYFNILRRISNW